MKSNAVMAAAIAAVILASVFVMPAQLASADQGHKDKDNGKDKPAVFNFIKDRQDKENDRGSNAGVLATQNITIKAKGIAITKSSDGYRMSDAVLSLTGDVQRHEGNHASTLLAGTLDIGSQHYQIKAEGKLKIDNKFGTLQVNSKTGGDGRLLIQGIVIPVQDDSKAWKFVADKGKLGGQTKIYGMIGDVQLSNVVTAPSNESKLTVKSLDMSGNAISGLYVNLAKNSTTVATGYMPFTFAIKSGVAYTVTVSDYEDKMFDHWENGSTSRTRTLTLSSDTTIAAYYKTSSAQNHTLNVNAVGPDGSVRHMWTNIQYGSSSVQTGYTPLNYYSGNSGATYNVTISDYQDLVFDHWDNGSTTRARQVTPFSATTVTAYFKLSPQSSGLDHFAITRIGNQTAGDEFTFAMTAIDGLGRVKTGYAGTVTISTNNVASPTGQANVMPSAYTFTTADAGQHVFSAKMYNAKNDVTITVSGDGKTNTSNIFSVSPAAVASVTVSPSSASVNGGGSTSFSAQARDQYGNQIVGATYVWMLGMPLLGTIALSSNTASATITAAGVSAATTTAVNVATTYGGATVSGSANLTVNP